MRIVLVVSLMLNLVLVVRWPSIIHPPLRPIDSPDHAVGVRAATPELAPQLDRPFAALHAIAAGRYRDGRDELRSLGFPNSTIQDVVLGAIHRKFGTQLSALRRAPSRYWEPVERRKSNELDSEVDLERQARALEAERQQIVRDILGLDWASVESLVTGRPDRLEHLVRNFAPGSRDLARSVLGEYSNQERDLIQAAGGTLGRPEREERDRLYRQTLDTLLGFLTPAELEDYELRTSPTAEHLRQVDLVGFEPTETEFRTIFRLRKAFDERQESISGGDQNRQPVWQALADLNQSLREALGEARFADYLRSQDYTFRGLIELAGEFDLPHEAAGEIYQVRQAVLRQARELAQDPALEEPRRAAALLQLRKAAEAAVRDRMGEGAFVRYTQLPIGLWLSDLE